MARCLLCNDNEADKKGSHIVPHFLLKRIENIEGKDGRDYELGFQIGELVNDSHFGRAILPEKLESTYGEIHEDDIAKNRHPLIEDFIFCSRCETQLARIESRYAKTLTRIEEDDYEVELSGEISLLFWVSVVWRMSVHGKSGLRVNQKDEELMRQILNNNLGADLGELKLTAMTPSAELSSIKYKVLRSPNYSLQNPTFLFLHPEFNNPYILIIDEYILLLSMDGEFVDLDVRDFYGIRELALAASLNPDCGNEKMTYLNPAQITPVNQGIIDKMKEVRKNRLNEFFDTLHIELGGKGDTMPA